MAYPPAHSQQQQPYEAPDAWTQAYKQFKSDQGVGGGPPPPTHQYQQQHQGMPQQQQQQQQASQQASGAAAIALAERLKAIEQQVMRNNRLWYVKVTKEVRFHVVDQAALRQQQNGGELVLKPGEGYASLPLLPGQWLIVRSMVEIGGKHYLIVLMQKSRAESNAATTAESDFFKITEWYLPTRVPSYYAPSSSSSSRQSSKKKKSDNAVADDSETMTVTVPTLTISDADRARLVWTTDQLIERERKANARLQRPSPSSSSSSKKKSNRHKKKKTTEQDPTDISTMLIEGMDTDLISSDAPIVETEDKHKSKSRKTSKKKDDSDESDNEEESISGSSGSDESSSSASSSSDDDDDNDSDGQTSSSSQKSTSAAATTHKKTATASAAQPPASSKGFFGRLVDKMFGS